MNKNETESDKVYENRTVGYGYDVPAFGKGVLKGQKGVAFVINPLTEDQAGLLKEKANTGQQFVLYRSPGVNAKGNYTYFLEFLAPKQDSGI